MAEIKEVATPGSPPQRVASTRAVLIAQALLERTERPDVSDLADLARTAADTSAAVAWVGPDLHRHEIGRAGDPDAQGLVVVHRATLHAADGDRAGFLELLDQPDHTLSAHQQQLVGWVADQVQALVGQADGWTVDTGVALVDDAGKLTGGNRILERIFGIGIDEVVGSDVLTFIHPEDLPGALDSFARTATFAGPKVPYDLRFRSGDGSWTWLEVTADNRLDDPEIAAIVFRLRDARNRLPEPAWLADQARVLEMIGRADPLPAVLEVIAGLLATHDPYGEGIITYRVESDDDLLALSTAGTHSPTDRVRLEGNLIDLADQVVARKQAILAADLADPEWGAVGAAAELTTEGYRSLWAQPIFVDGEVVGTVGLLRRVTGLPGSHGAHRLAVAASLAGSAISDLRQRREREYQASHDALTGLANGSQFFDGLLAVVETGRAAAVVVVNISRFQLINNSLGHRVADEFLVAVARRFSQALPDALMARLGADEYAVVLEAATAPDQAEAVATSLLNVLSEPFLVAGHRLSVTARAGIATTVTSPDAGALIRGAQAALRQARDGTHRSSKVQLYEPAIGEAATHSFVTETALRDAIRSLDFVVHYQPVFHLRTGDVVGLEALVRWPRGGRVMAPGDFIPLAEQTGLIDDIDTIVLAETCAQIRSWNESRAANDAPPLRAWVNFAPEDLLRPEFVAAFNGVLDAAGVPRAWIGIEITERSRVSYDPEALSMLADLRDLGTKIAIDDFGTGYSSLSYLETLPAQVLKIDMSFVRNLHQRRAQVMVRCILELADSFDLEVVAEGIETADQQATLVELGCLYGQGFHLGRPQPAHLLDRLITGKVDPQVPVGSGGGGPMGQRPGPSG